MLAFSFSSSLSGTWLVMFMYNKFILQGRFFPSFQFICCIQSNPSHIISKQPGRKDFSMEQLPIDYYKLLCKQKNSISISQ